MGLMTVFKAQKARKAHQEGRTEEAMKLYQEVMDEGNKDPAVFLPYSVLLIRNGRYAEAREMLVKNQKLPMGPDQKNQLFVNYAACVYKMGELQKGINLLERQHQKQPSGMIYETLPKSNYGLASAAALILFAIILVVTLINLQVSKKRVHY